MIPDFKESNPKKKNPLSGIFLAFSTVQKMRIGTL
jgi:hypothetical protein